ncbi:hypothetical protein MNBD_DELTA01-1397 [hydrothermal vent metagenome]|uniref:Type cbb3 cytochrome oxidase biogenesis protein CcoH n=1 Tax=hydrothermal vent metagenome TaxID=652676 RepID=A0A3B0QTK8_9ZZZZ
MATTGVIKKNMDGKKGLNWPLTIVVFFAVVFAMNSYLIYTAYKNFDGLTDENYYQKGLFYDANRSAAKKIGWSFALDFKDVPATKIDLPFVLRLRDKTGAPLLGASVVATLRRLTTDKYDDVYVLTETGEGYTGVMHVPLAGKWEVFVEAEKDGEKLVKHFEMTI